jgi:hypothetical protein
MKKVILSGLVVILFAGCNAAITSSGGSNDVNVTDGSYVILDSNQTISYKPNTDVQIVNLGDNSYYITCGGGNCPITIDNSQSTQTTTTTTATTYENNVS